MYIHYMYVMYMKVLKVLTFRKKQEPTIKKIYFLMPDAHVNVKVLNTRVLVTYIINFLKHHFTCRFCFSNYFSLHTYHFHQTLPFANTAVFFGSVLFFFLFILFCFLIFNRFCNLSCCLTCFNSTS